MARKARTVKTLAVIKSITACKMEEEISFSMLRLEGNDSKAMSQMVHDESEVRLRIGLENPDPNFPVIETQCKLTKFQTNKTCDKPTMKFLRISTDQIAQIASHVRAEQELQVTFTEVNPGLPFNGPEEAEPEPEAE